MSVLIVEDELEIRRLVRHHLQNQGLVSVDAATVASARVALRQRDFDIVILDLTLPDGSGLDVIEDIRRSGSAVHIIILSGATTTEDRVRALEMGADDYVMKPFSVRELMARVLAVRRRLDPATDSTIQVGHLEIDLSARRLLSRGEPVELTTKEFDLLAFFAARPGSVFSREDLLRGVWQSAPEWQQAATVTEHVRRLRTKIERDPQRPELLHTVRGVGYRFDVPAPSSSPNAEPLASVEPGVVFHREGRVESADAAAASLFGAASPEDLVGRHILEFVAPGSIAAAEERLRLVASGRSLRSQLFDIRRPDGTEIAVELTVSPAQSDDEHRRKLVFTQVTEPPSRVRHLATGIASEVSDAVIVADLHSHIRSWNAAAQRLYGWAEHEVLGRHILDVLHDTAEGAELSSAWHDLDATGHWHGEATHGTRDGSTVTVRASTTLLRDENGDAIGVISVNRPAPVAQAVDEAADVERVAEIRGGLARNEFEVYYQPVVALDDRRIVSLEALVRWNHPRLGLLSPAAFIDVAERSGLILDLGQFVLDEACRQAAAWRADGLYIDVAVNLSTRELADLTLVERVQATLEATGLDPSSLWLEVTETGLLEDVDQARGLLNGLDALGVGVSIDDFGTGWASLTYLKEFPVRALKIDGSFVEGVGHDPNDTAIARSILSLGAELDLLVIAEGIETEAQQRALEDLGCSLGQGYLYGRPTAAAAVPIHQIRRLSALVPGSTPPSGLRPARPPSSPDPGRRVGPSDGGHVVSGALAMGPAAGADTPAGMSEETVSDAIASMLRALLQIRSSQGAADLLQRTARALGATLVPAADAGPEALPIDLSLGEGPPVLATVEPFSVARMQLERILPRLVEDARRAVDLLRQNERLEHEADRDPLTGLGNRRLLDRVLQRVSGGVVIVLRLDHFPALNEHLGHAAGDEILAAFGHVLAREVRAGDTCCRVAGDEFVIVAGADTTAALELLDRLRESWAGRGPNTITFSAGLAAVGPSGGSLGMLAAHRALDRATTLGVDRVEVAGPTDDMLA